MNVVSDDDNFIQIDEYEDDDYLDSPSSSIQANTGAIIEGASMESDQEQPPESNNDESSVNSDDHPFNMENSEDSFLDDGYN